LSIGDAVLNAEGETGIVEASVVVGVPQTMVNLTVALAATYVVGTGQWVVHNVGFDSDLNYVLGNLGDISNAIVHNQKVLGLYSPSTYPSPVFSGVYDLRTSTWLAFPSGKTVAKGNKVPLPLVVDHYGGHYQTYDQLRRRIPNVSANGNEKGLIAFTLFYDEQDTFGMRWTSTSINNINWGQTGRKYPDGKLEVIHYAPEKWHFPFGVPKDFPISVPDNHTIELRNPVRNAVRIATACSVFDIDDGMG